MNVLDIILFVPILFGAWLGFRKGLVIELCTLAALILGTWAGLKFSTIVTGWIHSVQETPSTFVPVIAFAVCFLAVVILVFFLGKWLERFVKLTMLKPIDKILGGIFGLAKMTLLIAVAIVISEAWNKEKPLISEEMKEESLLYYPMKNLALAAIPALQYSELAIELMEKNEELIKVE